MKKIESLWDSSFAVINNNVSPIVILRNQGDVLTDLTGGRLVGITEYTLSESGFFAVSFSVKAPNITVRLFKIEVPQSYYPVYFYDITPQIHADVERSYDVDLHVYPINTDQEFVDILRKIFHTNSIKNILAIIFEEGIHGIADNSGL